MNLLLALSAHGYGHLSQVAPVINRMRQKFPDLKLTIQGDFDPELVAGRIDGKFQLVRTPADVGCAMFGPTEIDWETTLQWYRSFHAGWEQKLAVEQALLVEHQIDLVVADVPYLPLAAAKAQGVPAAAYSSLNWMDTLLENPAVEAQLQQEMAMMREIYAAADCFIQPEPSIPSEWLPNRRPVGPVAAETAERRDELLTQLDIATDQQLVLVSLGGIPMQEGLGEWPEIPGVCWLVDGKSSEKRSDVRSTRALNWPFPHYIGSVDLIVTKPGYGTFTEVARCGTPVLNIAREDWAESRYLEAWLGEKVALKTVPLEQVRQGRISNEVQALLKQGKRQPYSASGIEESVEILASLLLPSS